ncbi:MAG: wax ester/triacylglycerol synthase family O-acyltransferase [Myxococcota bacterium]|nr:wax ester/triacylglycerol synthase family O-acyltransferase [Myxococcota bacterium]
METLGLLDQLFYKLDEAGAGSLVMQGAMVLDPSSAAHPLDADRLAGHIASRVHGIPLLRQKVVRDPLGLGNLRLVEDPDFALHDHVTRGTVASPGDPEALTAYLERFSLEPLEIEKPLWRFEVADGLADGKLVVASKLHHSVLDGVGAMQTFASVYDGEPKEPEPWPHPRGGRADPTSGLSLVARALSDSAGRLAAAPRVLGRGASTLFGMLGDALRERVRAEPMAGAEAEAEASGTVSRTSLNVPISADRRAVAYRVFDIAEFKAVCRALGCKINDLAMLLCSSALERYFRTIGEEIRTDLWASMPLNTRRTGDGTSGNAVAVGMVNLRTTVPGLVERLKLIQKDAQASKDRWRPEQEEGGIGLADLEELISPLLLDFTAWVAARALTWDAAADRLLVANATISNVPGPRGDIYVAGARAHHSVPMIPVGHNMTLSWGITSLGSTLTIGFHACGRAVADKQLLIGGLDEAYARMKDHAEGR